MNIQEASRQQQIDDAVREAVRSHNTSPYRDYDPFAVAQAFVAALVGDDVPDADIHESIVRVCDVMQRNGNMAKILIGIAERLAVPPKPADTAYSIVKRAADAGDIEAIGILRSGLLAQGVPH